MAITAPDQQASTITVRQATMQFTDLYRAFSRRYQVANRIRNIRQFAAAAFALATPVVALLSPAAASRLGIAASLWLFLDRGLLNRVAKATRRRAVNTHEFYDTSLFEMPWNTDLADEPPPPPEDLAAAALKYVDRKNKAATWYTVEPGTRRPLDIVVCQRQNVGWNQRLRREWSAVLWTLAILWFAAGIVYGLARGTTLAEYLAQVLLPAMPGYVLILDLAEGYRDGAIHARKISERLSKMVGSDDVTMNECRIMQDELYRTRIEFPSGPRWYYELRSANLQKIMDAMVPVISRQPNITGAHTSAPDT